MKQVINITLGGVVFAIEQDAYEALAAYLEDIKRSLVETEDVAEIVTDIEGAIAEKFIAGNRSEQKAVTSADVEEVMSEMGSPADFGESQPAAETSSTSEDAVDTKKRLYRDTDDSVLAGVASGLAQYLGIDPVIIRLVFVISVFFNGLGILAYIILWLIVPVAKTTADKYAMRGEQLTIKEISERVKKNINTIEQQDVAAARGVWVRVRNVLDKLFKVLGTVVGALVRALRYLVGIVLVVGGALGLATMVSVYSVLLLSEKVLFSGDVQIALAALQSNALGIVAMASSFVMMAIPLVVLIIAGAGLMARRSFFTVQKVVALAVVWIVAAVLAGTSSVLQVEQVMQDIEAQEEQTEQAASTTPAQSEEAGVEIEAVE